MSHKQAKKMRKGIREIMAMNVDEFIRTVRPLPLRHRLIIIRRILFK